MFRLNSHATEERLELAQEHLTRGRKIKRDKNHRGFVICQREGAMRVVNVAVGCPMASVASEVETDTRVIVDFVSHFFAGRVSSCAW